MLSEKFPEIKIYWSFENNKAKEYRSAYQRLVVGQIEAVGDITVGVAIVEGMRRAIPIIVDYDGSIREQLPFINCAAGLFSDDYFPVVVFDEFYFNQRKKNNTVLSSVYHELGHLFMKHFSRDPKNKIEIDKGRETAMKNGEVFWQEQEADAFACHYIGKEQMLVHFDELKKMLIKNRYKYKISDYSLENALKEIDGRTKLIQEM